MITLVISPSLSPFGWGSDYYGAVLLGIIADKGKHSYVGFSSLGDLKSLVKFQYPLYSYHLIIRSKHTLYLYDAKYPNFSALRKGWGPRWQTGLVCSCLERV